MDFEVRLLGPVRVREGASWRQLRSHKTVALLCYLALRGGWVERIELATLFRPDAPQRRALRNLRTLLARARCEVQHTDLRIEATHVHWDIACDVHAVDEAVRDGHWIRAGHRKAGTHRVRELRRARAWPDALELVDALLAAHPDHEEIFVLAMEVHADAGRPSEALDAYRRFADRISKELGVDGHELDRPSFYGTVEFQTTRGGTSRYCTSNSCNIPLARGSGTSAIQA